MGGGGRGGWSEGLEREKAGSLAALEMTTRDAKATTRARAKATATTGVFPLRRAQGQNDGIWDEVSAWGGRLGGGWDVLGDLGEGLRYDGFVVAG